MVNDVLEFSYVFLYFATILLLIERALLKILPIAVIFPFRYTIVYFIYFPALVFGIFTFIVVV